MNITDIRNSIRERHKLSADAKVCVMSGAVTIKAAQSDDPYKFTARITTDSLDRQDEVVIPAGGNMDEFLESGAIFWNHDYTSPVGFPNKFRKIERGSKNGVAGEDFIECGGIFMKRPDDYKGEFFPDFARAFVMQAAAAGINPGVSIGFIPIESREPSKADRARYGDSIQRVHNRWKLLEFSIAPVQANQDAVVVAVGKGLIAKAAAKAVGIDVPDEIVTVLPPAPKEVQVIEETLILVRRQIVQQESVASMVQKQLHRQLLKEFGKIYA